MTDGTVLFSDRPSLPGGAGFPVTFISAAHGVGQATGPETSAATFGECVTDGEWNFLTIVTDSIEVTLGVGGTSFSITSTDPARAALFVGEGTVEGTRTR